MLRSCKAFYTAFELDNSTLVEHFDDFALMNAVLSEDSLKVVPRVVLKLLVPERETTVFLVDVKHDNVDLCANLCELRGMLYLLGPAEVANVNQAVNAFLQLNEKLQFKVIEFNKESKRIILSHSRIYEDAQRAEAREAKKATKRTATRKEEAPAIQNQAASTTLGDLDALAALKAKMQSGE